jgi:hypothetical protein
MWSLKDLTKHTPFWYWYRLINHTEQNGIENSLWNWRNAISYRFNYYTDNIDRCAFFEELNYGWYQMYIYPYDDMYIPTISDEERIDWVDCHKNILSMCLR